MNRRLFLIPLGLLLIGGAALYGGSPSPQAAPAIDGAHWPTTSGTPLRLAFAVQVGVDPQTVADVLAAWNLVPGFDMGVIAEGQEASCTPGAQMPNGIVQICASGGPGTVQYFADANHHITGGVIGLAVGVTYGRLCHEIGHVLVLDHPADPNGCMENENLLCPGPKDRDDLVAQYAHDDGYTVPDHTYAYVGKVRCAIPAYPTPTPTAGPTKVPFCVLHPTNKRCR